MKASQVVGLAGWVIVIPVGIAALILFDIFHPGFREVYLNAFPGLDNDKAGMVAFVTYAIIVLFIALPGLLLISISEVAESLEALNAKTERTNEALRELISAQKQTSD